MKTSAKLLCAIAMCAIGLCASAQSFILTNDKQLVDLATNPDKKIDNTTGLNKNYMSLNEGLEQAKRGSKCITIAFDEFFRQYRDDKSFDRNLTPDMDEYVNYIGKISDYISKDGVGLQLSLLSPLELGQAYKHSTGHSGRWIAYKVGARNPRTGKFSLQMWHQMFWTNNKGKTPVKLLGVRAYTFKEQPINNVMLAVNPADIKPLQGVKWEALDTLPYSYTSVEQERLRVYSDGGDTQLGKDYDRVMVVFEYETQEMDYFADDALPFLTGLLKKYHDRNINLMELYSDEMHIQQDWIYNDHQEDGQLNERYFTPSMARRFAKQYGQEFDERYLLYFASQPPMFKPTTTAVVNVEYMLGSTPEAIQRTYLMRDRYYRMLNNDVVDLFKTAKEYGEKLYGRELRTSAHASWAESPTIDCWFKPEAGMQNVYATGYEYTPNFLWSNTVQQAAAACYDYFKWGEYLQPTGNDFAECGWLDRDYYGAAMAASIGVINKYPNAYAAAWGMPALSHERRMAINYAFGCQPPSNYTLLTDGVIRDVDVLMLYPMNLVAVDQRFGSWMTQYGYANYLTSDQLLKLGKITPDGKMQVAAKKYGTIVALFEPLPEAGLLDMLQRFVAAGGKVLWTSAPPMLDKAGNNCTAQWQALFGARYQHGRVMGEGVSGQKVDFTGELKALPSQTVLTDFVVDRIFPVEAIDAHVVAKHQKQVVGTIEHYGNGVACYLGFRPRDDQSQSLGYEERTLFEALNAIGAYPATGKFKGVNDNVSYVSRTTPYFSTTFPNGATFLVNHYRTHAESWPGGFSRDDKEDAEILKKNPLPTDTIDVADLKVNGHTLTYTGRLTVAFNTGENGLLTAFMGQRCSQVKVDGKKYVFASEPVGSITFGRVGGDARHYRLVTSGAKVSIPVTAGMKAATVKDGAGTVNATLKGNVLTVEVGDAHKNRMLDITLQ